MGIKCDKCDGEFGSAQALEQHSQAKHSENKIVSEKVLQRMEKKEERRVEKAAGTKSAKQGKFLKYGIFLVVIIAVGYGVTQFTSPSGNAVAPAISAKIPTGPIHWHPMLTIKINGQQQDIPPEIGLGPTVHQHVHTHEDELVNGARLIHLENNRPTLENMKLGFFFQVWNKKFNKECIFDSCNTADKKIKMTVNGKENMDFENYIMADGDNIIIEYG